MALWIWRKFRAELPDDWEMLQFSRDSQHGRCAFADRHQFRLEFDWRVVDGPPDFERMISDYSARLKQQGAENVRTLRKESWRGLAAELDDKPTTRFGRHFADESCLVELVFLWPEKRNVALEHAVLDSSEFEPEYPGGLRRWRAFGMDLLAGASLAFENCSVEPASAEMVFAGSRRRQVERFARRGMVSEWLHEPVGQWLRSWAGSELHVNATATSEVGGHRIESLAGERRGPGLLAGRLHCDAAAWICPDDGRLYSASRAAPLKSTPGEVRLAGARFACCSRLSLAT